MSKKQYQSPEMKVVTVKQTQMICTSNLGSAGFTVEGTTIYQDYNDPTHGWGSTLDW